MSEPLWCQGCGDEIGPEHRDECDFDDKLDRGEATREDCRWCAACGCAEPCGCEYSNHRERS